MSRWWNWRWGIAIFAALGAISASFMFFRAPAAAKNAPSFSSVVNSVSSGFSSTSSISSLVSKCPTLTGKWKLIKVFPHDASAFTQGLTYVPERGTLLESTGLYGKSNLREVALESGKVVRKSPTLARQLFGEGICVVPRYDSWVSALERSAGGGELERLREVTSIPLEDTELLHLTWKSQRGFVWDPVTFNRLREFSYETTTKQGWGITLDAFRSELVVSDGSHTLMRWDPWTLKELGRSKVLDGNGKPISQLNELEWVCGEVLANIWYDDRIARIDPFTGTLHGVIDLSSLNPIQTRRASKEDVLNGIAVDHRTLWMDNASRPIQRTHSNYDPVADKTWPGGVRLFVTGKLWKHVYEISLETKN